MSRILIVEDNRHVSHAVARYLAAAGHHVAIEADGAVALHRLQVGPPDLVILDLSLPDMDGLDVCKTIRRVSRIPVLMLSARADERARIEGFEAGADDYVAKPFSVRELVLRANAILRRADCARQAAAAQPLVDGDLTIDTVARRATRRGLPLSLTLREYQLLEFLVRHPRMAFTREQLLRQVWDWTFGDASTVTVHVRRVREKIEDDPATPMRVITIWGVGYRYEPASVPAQRSQSDPDPAPPSGAALGASGWSRAV